MRLNCLAEFVFEVKAAYVVFCFYNEGHSDGQQEKIDLEGSLLSEGLEK